MSYIPQNILHTLIKVDFNNFIIENNILKYFQKLISLKSGNKSNGYINWRIALDTKTLAKQLVKYSLNFIDDNFKEYECIFGVPESASKLAPLLNYENPKIELLPMGRGKIKKHRDIRDKYFICPPKGRVIVLEDVITTGSSIDETIGKLQKLEDIIIISAICLTQRDDMQNRYLSMSKLSELKSI